MQVRRALHAVATANSHAEVHGLERKGRIVVGTDADIAIWDPEARRTIRGAELHGGADDSPCEGREVRGWPTAVVLGGKVVVREGAVVGTKGDGG